MDTNQDEIPQGSQYLLETDFTSLYNASLEQQSYWVLAMKAVRQAGHRAEHNSKSRGASHCWQQAKACKPCMVYNFSRDIALMNHKLQLEPQSRRRPHYSSADTLNLSNKRWKTGLTGEGQEVQIKYIRMKLHSQHATGSRWRDNHLLLMRQPCCMANIGHFKRLSRLHS